MAIPSSDNDEVQVRVRIVFGASHMLRTSSQELKIHVKSDGSESIREIKEKIAQAVGGAMTADDLLLAFGPNDRKMGRQYKGDPTVDESKILLDQYSVLAWLQRFPHWSIMARLLPPAPPPPGVAIKQAAAIAEKKNPERAVQDGRAQGEIPKISDLPAPWGPKPYVPPPEQELITNGYLPAKYPESSSPLTDL